MNRRRVALAMTFPLLAALLSACDKKVAPPEPVRAVRTWVVGSSTLVAGHEYAADVRARTESRLGFRVGGKLAVRPVSVGDMVRPGQLLAQLDPQDLLLGQQAAQSALSAAQVSLEQAQADHRRAKELRDQGFIGAAELERRDNAMKAARAQWEQAKAQAGNQSNQAAYARLTADVAGVVTMTEAEPGQVLAAGTPVVRLAHDGPRDAVFSVPEDRLQALRALRGQAGAVRVRLWAGGEELPATVREVAAAADPVTRTFLVKADLGRIDLALGQSATVLLPQAKAVAALRLPLTALAESGGKTQVWVLDPATLAVQPRPVEVATADGNFAVIASGLKPGDEIVTAGTHVLTPGLVVKRYQIPGGATVGSATSMPDAAASAASAASR